MYPTVLYEHIHVPYLTIVIRSQISLQYCTSIHLWILLGNMRNAL